MSCWLQIVQHAWKAQLGIEIMSLPTQLKYDELISSVNREFTHPLTISKYLVPENAVFWDFTHQEFYNHGKFVHGLEKARCSFWGRCPSDGLLQIGMGFTVVQLDSLDMAQEVVVSG